MLEETFLVEETFLLEKTFLLKETFLLEETFFASGDIFFLGWAETIDMIRNYRAFEAKKVSGRTLNCFTFA